MDQERLEQLADAAHAALNRGDTMRGLELVDEGLVVLRSELDESDDRILLQRVLRARVLVDSGRHGEAEDELAGVLAIRERKDGIDAAATLRVRTHLARSMALGGQPAAALLIMQAVLETRLRTLGPDDPDTLSARGHIAHFTALDGRVDEALELYDALLADRRRVLGIGHPDTESTEHNIRVFRADARLVDLDELRREARELEAERGPDDPATQSAYGRLAQGLLREREYDDAFDLARWMQLVRERVHGSDHRSTLFARRLAARAMAGLGFQEDAVEELHEVLAMMDEAGSGGDNDAVQTMADLVDFGAQLLLDDEWDPTDEELEALVAVWFRFRNHAERFPPGHVFRDVVEDHLPVFQPHLFDNSDEVDSDEVDSSPAPIRIDLSEFRPPPGEDLYANLLWAWDSRDAPEMWSALRGAGAEDWLGRYWKTERDGVIERGELRVELLERGLTRAVVVVMPSVAHERTAYFLAFVAQMVADEGDGGLSLRRSLLTLEPTADGPILRENPPFPAFPMALPGLDLPGKSGEPFPAPPTVESFLAAVEQRYLGGG